MKRQRLYICCILFFLLAQPGSFLFAQQAKLDVDGDLRLHSPDSGPDSGQFKSGMVLKLYTSPPSGSCDSGTLVYCSSDKRLYGCRGGSWQPLGAGSTTDRAEVTRIVAASNSVGSNNGGAACDGVGGTCANPRADYTCDGTDDHFVINRAIKDLPAAIGGTVFLLEGTYNIDGSVDINYAGPAVVLNKSNVTIRGAGRATVLKISGDAVSSVNVVNVPLHMGVIKNINIRELVIDGNSRTGLPNSNKGISIIGSSVETSAITIDKVLIKDIDGDGIYMLGSTDNVIVSDCDIQGNAGNGITVYCSLSGQGNYRTDIRGNKIGHNPDDIPYKGNDGCGVYIYGAGNSEVLVQKNIIQGNGRSGINLQMVSYPTIQGNHIISNGAITGCNDVNGGCEGIFLKDIAIPGYKSPGYTTDSTLICENTISENSGMGIKLAGNVHHAYMYRNALWQNGKQNIYLRSSTYNFISGNVSRLPGISGTGKRAIEIGFGCNETHISGNRIAARLWNDYYGIYIDDNGASVTNNYLYANKLDPDAPTYNNHPFFNYNTDYTATGWQQHAALFTDKFGLNLQLRPMAGSRIDLRYYAVNYVQMSIGSDSDLIIDSGGRATGDILIIENNTDDFGLSHTLTLRNSENISVPTGQYSMERDDTLVLLWDGEKWVMIGGAHNY